MTLKNKTTAIALLLVAALTVGMMYLYWSIHEENAVAASQTAAHIIKITPVVGAIPLTSGANRFLAKGLQKFIENTVGGVDGTGFAVSASYMKNTAR